MKNILDKIYNGKILNFLESFKLFDTITQEKINTTQITAILAIMSARKESTSEIYGARQALIQYVKKICIPKYFFLDIVGTGGDQQNSFSISTVSAIVAAYYGIKVSKICNFSASGNFGSANLLHDLNINIGISAEKSIEMLNKFNICFLLASQYFTSFQKVTNIRKKLKKKTIFNLLGPLLNPMEPKYALIGIYNSKFMLSYAKILKKLNYKHVIIVNSNGIDEVTLHSTTEIVELQDNKLIMYQLIPEDFGLKKKNIAYILQKNQKENYEETIKLFQGLGNQLYVETIAINVSLLLKIYGENNLKKNTQKIINLINSGKIYHFLTKLSKFTYIT